jgi:hypothetical protein
MIVNPKTIEIRSITLKRRALLGCAKIENLRAASRGKMLPRDRKNWYD